MADAMVLVTGLLGSGKTTLAMALAAEVADPGPHPAGARGREHAVEQLGRAPARELGVRRDVRRPGAN